MIRHRATPRASPSRTWSAAKCKGRSDSESPSSRPSCRHRENKRHPTPATSKLQPTKAAQGCACQGRGRGRVRALSSPHCEILEPILSFLDVTHRAPCGSCPTSPSQATRQACDPHTDPHGGSALAGGAQREAGTLGEGLGSSSPNIQNDPSNGDGERRAGLLLLNPSHTAPFSRNLPRCAAHHHGRLVGLSAVWRSVGWCFSCSPAHTR